MKLKDHLIETAAGSYFAGLADSNARAAAAAAAIPVHPDYNTMIDGKQVQEMVRASMRTIMRMVFNGAFPEPVSISERRRVWRKSEVLQFLSGCRNWPAL